MDGINTPVGGGTSVPSAASLVLTGHGGSCAGYRARTRCYRAVPATDWTCGLDLGWGRHGTVEGWRRSPGGNAVLDGGRVPAATARFSVVRWFRDDGRCVLPGDRIGLQDGVTVAT